MSVRTRVACSAMLVAALAVPAVAGCADFEAVNANWAAMWNANDAAGLAALYSEDAVLMPPNTEAAKGRAAIKASLAEEIAAAEATLDIVTVEQEHSGTLGFASGTYTMTNADGETIDEGKWLEVRKKVGGTWYIHSDMWNSSLSAE